MATTSAAPPAPPEAIVIRYARERLGWPQVEAARRAGMTGHTWSNHEVGHRTVRGFKIPSVAPAATLARMARAVGVTPDELRRARRADAAAAMEAMWPPGSSRDVLPSVFAELSDMYPRLDAEGRTKLTEHVRTLVDWSASRLRRNEAVPRSWDLFSDAG